MLTPNQFQGGMTRRRGLPTGDGWRAFHGDHELHLQVEGASWRCFRFDDLALLIRGYVVPRALDRFVNPAFTAEQIVRHYRCHGNLPTEELEGSFTLALLDGARGRVVLYRNLVGSGFTYYTQANDGFRFGSNLASLVDGLDEAPEVNQSALPAYFLYRYVPGRDTLFAGVHRLMPGEEVAFDATGMKRTQRHTFADWQSEPRVGADAIDRVEDTMRGILADCGAACPATANLLSGGVDSAYLQVLWNQVHGSTDEAPSTFSVSANHEPGRLDTQYAVSAAAMLGTNHALVHTNAPYASYLLRCIACSGETPHHVQTAYFPAIAGIMAGRGHTAALCGQGADALFGLTCARTLQGAGTLRSLLPFEPLRRLAAGTAGWGGFRYLRDDIHLAGRLDRVDDWQHPINRVGVFADLPAVTACFGETAVTEAFSARRDLLEQYRVNGNVVERVHACDFLSDSIDSASLWNGLFNVQGTELLCPYLDSRLLRLAFAIEPQHRFPYRRPKELLKRALARHAPRELAYRGKLAFGQPVFEWLAPGGQLRRWAERVGRHEFVKPAALAAALAQPTWFLYSLLCFDLWHKLFIERSLPRSRSEAATVEPRMAAPRL